MRRTSESASILFFSLLLRATRIFVDVLMFEKNLITANILPVAFSGLAFRVLL